MNYELLKFNSLSPLGSLEAYIQRANEFPLLSAKEELELATRFYEKQDLEAARTLVLSHLRFVVRIAKNYMGYGLPVGDLIQEGNIGLMKAVKRFNPHLGVRLVSFAVHWIKAEIHEFIIRNWRIVKIATTKAQRKLFFNLKNFKKRLGWFTQEEVNDVAADLGVSPEEVIQMEQRLNAHDLSFDEPNEDEDHSEYVPQAPKKYLTSNIIEPHLALEQDKQTEYCQDNLALAIDALDDRSREIVKRRWLNEKKATLQELADSYGVSAERIRQIEQNALQLLKNSLSPN